MKKSLVLLLPFCLAASTLAAPNGGDHETKPPPAAKEESAVDYMWEKSDEAFHAGDYERAIGLHKGIVAIAPDEVESYGNGAWLMWSLGRGEEAIAFIERGLKANPKNWEMWKEAAQHYGLQKQTEKERDAYRQAIELAPKDEDTQMLRRAFAHAAEKSGDLALAVATWRQLTTDFPTEAVNKNNLARVEKMLAEQKNQATDQAALPSRKTTI